MTLLVSTKQEQAVQPQKLEYVDALRGLAILGVIAVHSLLMFGSTQHLPALFVNLVSNGAWGVRLFFIASAFTLFLSLHGRHKAERRPVLNFYLRRFFRIAPLYYLGILGYSAWAYFIGRTLYPPSKTLTEALFLHGLTPSGMNSIVPGGWSITVEMMFYLLVPLLARAITSLNRAVWFLLGTVLLHAALSWLFHRHPLTTDVDAWNLFLAWYLPKQLTVFALGFIFYFLTRYPLPIRPGALLAAALLGILAFGAKASLAQAPASFALLPEDLGMSAALMLFAWALSAYPFRFFVNRFTRRIGELSFSLYLIHFGVLYVLNWRGLIDFIAPTSTVRAAANYGVRFAVVLGISCALAYLLHRFIEVWGQQVGRRVVAWLERR